MARPLSCVLWLLFLSVREVLQKRVPPPFLLVKKIVSPLWDILAISQKNVVPPSTIPHKLINLFIDFLSPYFNSQLVFL